MAASIMSVNLLPWRNIQKNQQKKQLSIHLFLVVLIIFSIFVIIHAIFTYQFHKKLIEKNFLNNQIKSSSISDQEKFNITLLKRLMIAIKIQNQADVFNRHLVRLLTTFSNLLMPSMFLQWMQVTDDEIDLNGIAPNESSVHQLIYLLDNQKMAKNIALTDLTKDYQNYFDFHIRIIR